MEVGVKYRGWATLNEYGQINFTPEQTGAQAGNKKLVVEGKGFSVYTTKKKVVVHLSLDRNADKMNIMSQFYNIVGHITEELRKYAF